MINSLANLFKSFLLLISAVAICSVAAAAQDAAACDAAAYYYRKNAVQGLNIRSGPGLKHRIIRTLRPNRNSDLTYYVFRITGERNGWFRLNRITDKTGGEVFRGNAWIYGKLLAVALPGGGRQVPVRARPHGTGRVIGSVMPDKEYGIAGCRGKWVRISYGAKRGRQMKTGWIAGRRYCGDIFKDCPSAYGAAKGAAAAAAETRCAAAAFVSDPGSGVNVRSAAGTNTKILQTIPADPDNTLILIEGARGDWLKISSARNSRGRSVFKGTGWIYAPLVSVRLDGADRAEGGGLRVYKGPDRSSGLTGYTGYGVRVPLEGCRGNWLKVRLPATGTGVSGLKATGWVTNGSYCGTPWGDCL